ncbi:MAG: beta-ketoacyl-[acyl-carrier-protein] synthase family protein, partial [Deltaproteobacteria bacterium]|nr:beta-ketoacyl-[acyl-carrier-protein] synthase family protein [Deltaproteobacteria bacterium]
MRRVAITGVGIISSIGNSAEDFFNNLMAGKSGVRKITAPFSDRLSVTTAAEVDFDPSVCFSKKQIGLLDRASQFALAAASQAWKDSAIELNDRAKLFR